LKENNIEEAEQQQFSAMSHIGIKQDKGEKYMSEVDKKQYLKQ